MTGSRRLYVELAATIDRHRDAATPEGRDAIRALVLALCDDLKVDNRAFDRARFLDACGIEVDR